MFGILRLPSMDCLNVRSNIYLRTYEDGIAKTVAAWLVSVLSHHDICELEPKGIEPSTSALRMRNILVYFAPVRIRQFETDIAKHLVLKQFLEID